jgi:predicted DNA-binding transcriptional regulator AlpA
MIAYDQKRAAKAMCMSEKQFSELVDKNVLPKPVVLDGIKRWFHADLDAVRKAGSEVDLDEVSW